jgi:flagellar biosynthesis protein FlhG
MKALSELDYFEILEVSRDASPDDIERAYRLAQTTWADDSLAGYSVFGDGDSETLRERIESAYRVLSNPASRSAYAASLSGEEVPVPQVEEFASADAIPTGALASVDEFGDLEDDSRDFDGARLRRARMSQGMEIEEISAITKVSSNYLLCLEQERFEELPAPVYVRGFVMAYANCVRLDATRVAASYMKRVESGRPRDPLSR